MNENWLRWLSISLIEHFESQKAGYEFKTEQDLPDESWDLWCELFIIEPSCIELTKNYFEIRVSVNLVCNEIPDGKDDYRIQKITGFFSSLCTKCISVYQYGVLSDDLDNDESLFGILQLQGSIDVSNYTANLEPGTKLNQTRTSASYKMSIQTT